MLPPRLPNRLLAGWLLLAAACGLLLAVLFALLPFGGFWPTVIAALAFTIGATFVVPGGLRQARELLAEHQRLTSENQRMVETLQQELERHRRLELELKDAKKQTEAAMMAKGEFLATMSHEIRTPLNGILPVIDMLLAARLTADQADLLRTAHGSAKQMLRIVDDILDYSKLEANKVDLETTGFNLRELAESVVRLMTKQAETKGLLLHLEIDPGVRLPVRGDPTRLRQVLSNLLSNAIKFTDRGRVTLRIQKNGEERLHHPLRFEVVDTGIGIPKDKLSQLFVAFSQADASTTRMYGGTGLGLVICKRIITLMGGRIGVDSDPGQGSRFWFEVPLSKAVGDLPAARADLSGARVLLMTPDPAQRERLATAMQNWGLRLSYSSTPPEALQMLRSAAARGMGGGFEALVADLRDGASAAVVLQRALSRSPEVAGLKLLLLTGAEPLPPETTAAATVAVLRRDAASADLKSGLADLLVPDQAMPLPGAADAEDFGLGTEPAPSLALAALPQGSSVGAFSEAAIGRRARVLLVEDNPVNLLVAQKLIAQMDLICESAGDGERALERMAAGNLDVVLMDCQMPVKDGYTATREWREYENAHRLPRLPIVAMTANAMAGDRQRCLDAGMDDYLSKPVDRSQLEDTLKRWLQRGALARRNAAPAAPTQAPAPAAPALAPTLPTIPGLQRPEAPLPPAVAPAAVTPPSPAPATPAPNVLDDDVLAELREVMGAEFGNLVQMFLVDAAKYIQQLEEAAAGSDLEKLIAPAHTLKSSSANLGAMAVSAAAKRIEVGAREGALPRPAVAVAVLEAEFQRAGEALRKLVA
ncbi:hybrid sensor histidine kinase/response regulator [Silanimonas sp.]|uniref:hybrid sensor histidine kinase/response regulator n=1 Tax=Silanimonas sp. TaxID=1929290 RepID=UPI0022C9D740|nr:hybrid sensor histidine kinase/response regulator [Silanimonas sp.]MCZ8167210.1 ATP-binding protein [Silanimonas sp.]